MKLHAVPRLKVFTHAQALPVVVLINMIIVSFPNSLTKLHTFLLPPDQRCNDLLAQPTSTIHLSTVCIDPSQVSSCRTSGVNILINIIRPRQSRDELADRLRFSLYCFPRSANMKPHLSINLILLSSTRASFHRVYPDRIRQGLSDCLRQHHITKYGKYRAGCIANVEADAFMHENPIYYGRC